MVTDLDGHVPSSHGDLGTFFNCSGVAMQGRNLYLFLQKERTQMRAAVDALAPNVTIERTALVRPRERKPLLARVTIGRAEDDRSLPWKFAAIQDLKHCSRRPRNAQCR